METGNIKQLAVVSECCRTNKLQKKNVGYHIGVPEHDTKQKNENVDRLFDHDHWLGRKVIDGEVKASWWKRREEKRRLSAW